MGAVQSKIIITSASTRYFWVKALSKKFSLIQNCNAPLIAPNPDGWEMTLKECSLPAADGDDEMRKYFHINSAAKEKLGTL